MDDLPLYTLFVHPALALLCRLEAAREAEAHWRHVATCHALHEGREVAGAQAEQEGRRVARLERLMRVLEGQGLVGAA